MSTLKVNRIEPRTGDTVEIVGLDIPEPTESPVKAWVNFNGTGTVAIRDSMNVSSITDNATGQYFVNFSASMPDANFSAVASKKNETTNNGFACQIPQITESFIEIQIYENDASADSSIVSCAVFR